MTLHDSIAGVDRGELADGNIRCLGFGNPQHGLEFLRTDHLGECRARDCPLPHLHRQFLQHAARTGPHHHRFHLAPLKRRNRAKPIDLGLLHVELLLHVVGQDCEPLLLDLHPGRHLLRLVARSARFRGGDEILSHQIRIRLRLPLRLAIGRLGRGDDPRLGEPLRFEIGLERDQFRFGGGELALRLKALDLNVWITQLEQKGVFVDHHPGLDQHPIHSSRSDRGNPPDLLGNQGARTPDLPHHRPLPHSVHPEGPELDRGGGRLEPAQPHGRGHHRDDGGR